MQYIDYVYILGDESSQDEVDGGGEEEGRVPAEGERSPDIMVPSGRHYLIIVFFLFNSGC